VIGESWSSPFLEARAAPFVSWAAAWPPSSSSSPFLLGAAAARKRRDFVLVFAPLTGELVVLDFFLRFTANRLSPNSRRQSGL
jgi:hypothetical protein